MLHIRNWKRLCAFTLCVTQAFTQLGTTVLAEGNQAAGGEELITGGRKAMQRPRSLRRPGRSSGLRV